MIQIRPVSDLRNKFPEIENIVNSGKPVYLTKNGYGAMVVLSLEEYANLTDDIEMKLDEDCASVKRMSAKNKKKVHDTRKHLINSGYDPCKNCNP